jgi:uncharacterized protein YbjT (DUF2867 family)
MTGATGYIGRPLVGALHQRGYDVYALVRKGSEAKLPDAAVPVLGDALDASSFASAIPIAATVIHLVGTPRPNPTKAAEFQRVDVASIRAITTAAQQRAVRHLVYVSVAHPSPVMQTYIAARKQGERLVEASGIPATILRPWYVLGPGHRWPYLLIPVYVALRCFAATRGGAERLGLVTLNAMVAALVKAVETPPTRGVRIIEVAEIRQSRSFTNGSLPKSTGRVRS